MLVLVLFLQLIFSQGRCGEHENIFIDQDLDVDLDQDIMNINYINYKNKNHDTVYKEAADTDDTDAAGDIDTDTDTDTDDDARSDKKLLKSDKIEYDTNSRMVNMDDTINLNITNSTSFYDNVTLNDTNLNTTYCSNDFCISDEDYMNMIDEYMFPTAYEWGLIALHSMVFLIGLIGNALVCVAVYRNHSMRTVTNYFIVNLAVADFMVILFCLPPTVLWDVTETWFMGEIMCKIVLYIQTVSVTVSVLTLTFISIDRWYAICFPLKFKSTTSRAKTAIVVIWLIAFAFDIPELIVLTTIKRLERVDTHYFTQCVASWSSDSDTTWSVAKMILLYALPFVFMSIAYFQIVCVLWRSDNIPGNMLARSGTMGVSMNHRDRGDDTFTMNSNASTEAQLRSRRKAAKMLVAVVVMFAVCYFPVHLFSVMRITMALPQNDLNTALALLSHWMCYANSAVNPVIYNFMSGKFRKEFRKAFGCNICCKKNYQARRHRNMTRSSTYVYRFTPGGSTIARTEIMPLSQSHLNNFSQHNYPTNTTNTSSTHTHTLTHTHTHAPHTLTNNNQNYIFPNNEQYMHTLC